MNLIIILLILVFLYILVIDKHGENIENMTNVKTFPLSLYDDYNYNGQYIKFDYGIYPYTGFIPKSMEVGDDTLVTLYFKNNKYKLFTQNFITDKEDKRKYTKDRYVIDNNRMSINFAPDAIEISKLNPISEIKRRNKLRWTNLLRGTFVNYRPATLKL